MDCWHLVLMVSKMRRYRATFTGRKIGALGVSYRIETEVMGNDEDRARINLYDKFEHIKELRLCEVEA